MKFNFHIIMLCLAGIALFAACDKATLQSDSQSLQSRGDCDECPALNECCCGVWLQPFEQTADLIFCGTSNGLDNCSGDAVGNCESFSGGGQQIQLHYINNPKDPFCMIQGEAFWVYNNEPSGVVNIIITCQNNLTTPDTIHLQIPAGQRRYVGTNNSCEVGLCG
jgi:hypothetical protein